MPELPEVEVVRAGLAPAVTGARVAAVEVLDARALTRHVAASGDFEALADGGDDRGGRAPRQVPLAADRPGDRRASSGISA